jgi:aspartyl-tRNA(Asn)/glutamyl-tRNA(Gln) amidotransferase subunit C
MALTREEVLHIAKLARLGLTDADVERYQRQLSDILDYFARLAEVDTTDVPPTAYAVPVHNVLREDTPRPSTDREAILANAPNAQDGYIRVQAVLE